MSIESLPVDRSASSEPTLTPVLSSRWAFTWQHLATTFAFAALFVFLNHLPLRPTDLWSHVVYGDRIVAERAIPTVDPLLPLAEGMRVVDLSWLAQVVFSQTFRFGGAEALVGLFTVVVWLSYVVLGRTCFLATKNLAVSTLLTGLALNVGWNRLTTIRPENFALLLFAVLLWLLTAHRLKRDDSILVDDRRGEWKLWLGIPLIFVLWANLHGSFFCGLAVLACFFGGRVLEVAWHERSLRAVTADRETRRRLYWLELAAAATLVNPYGIDAWIEALQFSSNPIVRDVVEWQPLVMIGVGGREFMLACVALMFVLRHSRKPVAPTDVLLLGVFGLMAAMQVRMTGWFAFVWAVTIAPHLADVVSRAFAAGDVDGVAAAGASSDGETPTDDDANDLLMPADGRSYRYTLACAGVLWIAFAFTTFARPLLGGEPRSAESLYGPQTPLQLTAWLRKNPPVGQVYNPQYWGDWLGWAGPQSLRLFANTHVHLMPRGAWADYRRISDSDNGWEVALERHRVKTAIVDKVGQSALARAIRLSSDWVPAYEDDQALVMRRRAPVAAATKPEPSKSPAPATGTH